VSIGASSGQAKSKSLDAPHGGTSLSRQSAAIVVLYALTLLLVNLGQSRVLTLHEVQYCQPAREMIESGNWLVPTVAGVPFTWRLPATSWVIALTMELTGSQSEAVVRLPGVVIGALLALLVAALTARWFGNRAGLFAGLMQATTVATLQLARLAEGEIHLGLSVAAALGAFACANVDSPRGRMTGRWLSVVFYLATGWAFLIKALIGPAFIFSACGAFLLLSRDRRVLRFMFDPLGLLAFALCVFPWSIAAYRVCPEYLEMQISNHFGRFRGELGSQGSPWFYVSAVPLKILPWTPLALLACYQLWRQGKWREPIWMFGLCWMLPGLILLSASRFKSAHYPAPLLPPLLMAAAVQLCAYLQSRATKASRGSLALSVVGLLACTVAAILLATSEIKIASGLLVLVAILALGIAGIAWCEYRRWLDRQVAVGFGVLWLLVAGVWIVVMPSQDSYRGNWELAHRANQQIPTDKPVYLVELTEDQIVYYLQSRAVWLYTREQLLERLAQSPDQEAYVLTPEYVAQELAQQDHGQVLDRCETLRRSMAPRDRITLVKMPRPSAPVASSSPASLR
jgi:4-amino-4-deoxy-L-arabinose transferase-like glycosyltransferase